MTQSQDPRPVTPNLTPSTLAGIEEARVALAAWDRYQPDISTETIVEQANDLANALRRLVTLSAQPLADAGDVEREGGDYAVSGSVYESAVKGRQDFRSAFRELRERAFDPTDEERAVIQSLAAEKDLSEQAVMRQALRFYQLLNHRLKAGETFAFSGDAQRSAEFAALALPSTAPDELRAEGDGEDPIARCIYASLHHLMRVTGTEAQKAYEQTARSIRALARPDRMAEMEGLRALSEKATQGEWTSRGRFIGTPLHMSAVGEVRDQNGNWSDTSKSTGDAAFIVACVNHVRAALSASEGGR